jgi:putative NADPH-quinone reductase
MGKRIVVIQGHPDGGQPHLGGALADAYVDAATSAGHEVRRIDVATLDFPVLRSRQDWERGAPPPAIATAQESIRWSEHLVILYPLWLGEMPALLKAFLEQVARPGFAFEAAAGLRAHRPLSGRSARIVVTMGMPASLYRWYYRAHGLRNLERNILGFVGIAPVESTLLGHVDTASPARRKRWLERMRALGAAAR